MPTLTRPDGTIAYEVHGEGFPVLLFAPGGLRSRRAMWPSPPGGPARPWVDWIRALPAAGFAAIAMDQRNAGESRTAIEADHGWHSYAADHLALMDHLGFRRFAVLGGCIGGSFCLKAVEVAPDRIACAVLQNPIGFNPEHPAYFPDSHAEWSREQRAARPDLSEDALAAFGRRMWAGDFVFSVDRAFCRACPVPSFLLPGTDIPHPAVTSTELARLLPGVEVLADWRGPDHLAQQEARVVAFLRRHAH
ncbi:alpha/beta fold hydrolase [Paracraurococcus lichenis]|uniref:Alpha/beta fold hydrolase n=1 Tax=Paracraurococcus lichenis TaxID=3064888 RepID=A0ABT9DX25_9PROT|nr:alpha/beta fold hydrolase [Paracraurococcus sp. LOR1-02]MDO9708438.1 alpha/beta fold hydrolase [Paracraurococcus sp. LOR1-02]